MEKGVSKVSGEGEILSKLLSSEVKGDLLVLFHKNLGLIDTVDNVARRIGRTGKAIEADLKDLVGLGILKTKQVGASQVVFIDRARDKEVQEALANYFTSLKKERQEAVARKGASP